MSKTISRPDAATGTTTVEKVMTEEILKGFVEEATQNRIDIEIDVLLDSVDEDIPMDDCLDFLWSEDILFNEDSYDMILEDIDAALCDEGYNINICEWCKENDIDLKDMIYEVAEQIVEDRIYAAAE